MKEIDFAIGKDANTGEVINGELTPNLLIMGGTSGGKTMIASNIISELASKYSPEELKLILVDTKTVCFAVFDDLPHLMWSVVKDVKEFPGVLDFLVEEVGARYELLRNAKCNSARKYNQKYPNKMPPILVVIDEIADIMIANDGMEAKLIRFFQAYQRASDVHFIINATTSGNFTKWLTPLMMSHLGANKILLRPSRDDSYNVLPELKDKLRFDDVGEGYYFKDGDLRKFTFDEFDG